jgi:hypothetical protein
MILYFSSFLSCIIYNCKYNFKIGEKQRPKIETKLEEKEKKAANNENGLKINDFIQNKNESEQKQINEFLIIEKETGII